MSISGIPASVSAPVPLAVASKSPLVVSVGALWYLNTSSTDLLPNASAPVGVVGSTINTTFAPLVFV